jgi:hypothetical protein
LKVTLALFSKLRSDEELFKCLVHNLDNAPLGDESLDHIAEELVCLFASSNLEQVDLLRLLRSLVQELFEAYLKGEYPLLFEEKGLMLNRMLKAFFNN